MRKNHIITAEEVIDGREATGVCGTRFVVDKDRDVFAFDDCARCMTIAKRNGYAPLKQTPILMRARPYTTSVSTPTDWSV